MKNYEFMAEKYPLFNNDPKETEFPIPEGHECFRVCRYGDGYVYRVLKELTDDDEFPCRGYLYLFSVTRQELYVTDIYDQVKIHMTDFEYGCPYATSFELLRDGDWTRVDCNDEVWRDDDMKKLPVKLYRKTQDDSEEIKVCNMCGKTFDLWDEQENFSFDHQIGWGSTHDLHRICLNLCCHCFDKVIDWVLPQCKHNPISEYRTHTQEER